MRSGGIALLMVMAVSLARPVPSADAAKSASSPVPSTSRFT